MYENNGIFTFTGSCTNCRWRLRAAFLFAACSKDPAAEAGLRGGYLRFEVTEANSSRTRSQSRTAEDSLQTKESAAVFTLQGETPADTLFLHASVADGIAAPQPNAQTEPAADPCHTYLRRPISTTRSASWLRLYGLVERNRVSAGLYVQRRGDEGIVVDDLLPLAGQRAQYPLLRLRTL